MLLFALPACAHSAQHFTSAESTVEQVLAVADQRMAVMQSVAAWKWQNKKPISDPPRERVVTNKAVQLAGTMGIAPESIQEFFNVQVSAARDAQAHFQEGWKSRGFDFPPPIPTLAGDLRPKLDRLTGDLLRAVYLAAPELQRTDFVTTYAPQAQRLLRAEGWTDAARQNLLTAMGKVRMIPPQGHTGALGRITASGVLRIGTTGDYAPFTIEHDGVLGGADVALAESLAARLHVTPVFIRTTWGSLMKDLHARRFDLAISGITVTPARKITATFSIPYSSGGKTIITRCADVRRYADLADVDRPGVRVIANPGGTNEQYVRANLHRATIVMSEDNRAIFDQIRAGHADIMITDDVEVELQTRRHPDLCRALPGTLTQSDRAVLMPRDAPLVAAVNAWLGSSIRAGEPGRLLQKSLSP